MMNAPNCSYWTWFWQCRGYHAASRIPFTWENQWRHLLNRIKHAEDWE
jgi:hypothetical protein